MLFNSYIFIFLFLPLSLCGWYGLNRIGLKRPALIFLTGMSLWFYGYFNVYYLLLIVGSISGNYLLSLILYEVSKRHGNKERLIRTAKTFTLACGMVLNLGLLFYFKYYDFFVGNINVIFKTDITLKHILLPLGISFFTFQQLSFIVDRGLGRAEHYGLTEYAAFVTFFPQLVAGPIVLHTELIPQLLGKDSGHFDHKLFYDGFISFVLGLSKKVLLADTFALIVNRGFEASYLLDSFSAVAVMIAYFLELYFDFSGYSDMAVGLGMMFGIRLPENFNSPYKASTLKELWTRWHMTLTRFMTTYVYIPLGGSRKGRARTMINLFIVFMLSGLWHGAAWTYVVWGICTGLLVIWDSLELIKLPRKVGVILTDIEFTLLLIPFRSTSLAQAGEIFGDLVKGWKGNLPKLAEYITAKIPEFYLFNRVTLKLLPTGGAVINTFEIVILLCLGIFVVTRKNVAQIRQDYGNTKWLSTAAAVLLAYCIISFSQVSTFIYFNF